MGRGPGAQATSSCANTKTGTQERGKNHPDAYPGPPDSGEEGPPASYWRSSLCPPWPRSHCSMTGSKKAWELTSQASDQRPQAAPSAPHQKERGSQLWARSWAAATVHLVTGLTPGARQTGPPEL